MERKGVRDVLTNELYVGRYSVAGVDGQVEGYRVLDDDTFEMARKTMRRFKAGGAKRPPMPEDRRREKIERIFIEYIKSLNELEPPDLREVG